MGSLLSLWRASGHDERDECGVSSVQLPTLVRSFHLPHLPTTDGRARVDVRRVVVVYVSVVFFVVILGQLSLRSAFFVRTIAVHIDAARMERMTK